MPSNNLPRPKQGAKVANLHQRIALAGSHGIFEIQWRSGLLEQIRSHVTDGYSNRGAGGVELGGVLYGYRVAEVLQVSGWKPMLRTDDSTDHFYLNSRQEQHLRRMIASPPNESNLKGAVALGWFRSRTRGECYLDDRDASFHLRHFGEPFQFGMVVKPSHQRPAQAAIYFREGNSGELSLQPAARLDLAPGPVAVGQAPAVGSLPEVIINRSAVSSVWDRLRPYAPWAAIACLLTVLTIGGLQWNQSRTAAMQAQPLGLKVHPKAKELEILWNPRCGSCRDVKSAKLSVGSESYILSEAEFRLGHRSVLMKRDGRGDLAVKLSTGATEESTRVIASLN